MKVLMTADAVGGVFTYALNLSAELGKLGVEVILATMGRGLTNAQKREVEAVSSIALRPSTFKLEWMEDPWLDVERSAEWLQRLETVLKPDIIHFNTYSHAAYHFRAPKLVVAHSDVRSWFHHVKGEPAGDAWHEYTVQVKRGLAAADLLVAPTQSVLHDIDREYETEGRHLVIPNGSPVPPLGSLDDKEPFAVAVGRLWDEAKNLRMVNEAGAGISWPVYAIGGVAEPGREAEAGRLHVTATGEIGHDETLAYLERGAIFVHPARYEPFGLAVLEAARQGCALVLGDIPSLRENWEGVALFVDPDRPELLSALVEKLSADRPLREALGQAAQERSLRFDVSSQANAYLTEYKRLLNEKQFHPHDAWRTFPELRGGGA